jgi:hypothetical protein
MFLVKHAKKNKGQGGAISGVVLFGDGCDRLSQAAEICHRKNRGASRWGRNYPGSPLSQIRLLELLLFDGQFFLHLIQPFTTR